MDARGSHGKTRRMTIAVASRAKELVECVQRMDQCEGEVLCTVSGDVPLPSCDADEDGVT